MSSIAYKAIHHNRENRIPVLFEHDAALNEKMRQVPGVKWSRIYKCWTIPDTTDNRIKCKLAAVNAPQSYHFEPGNCLTPFVPQISETTGSNLLTICNAFM